MPFVRVTSGLTNVCKTYFRLFVCCTTFPEFNFTRLLETRKLIVQTGSYFCNPPPVSAFTLTVYNNSKVCRNFQDTFATMCDNGLIFVIVFNWSFSVNSIPERIGKDQYHYSQYYLYQYYYIVLLTTLELSKAQFKNFPKDNSVIVFPQQNATRRISPTGGIK